MRRWMQRLTFAGRITWGATDCALYNQLAGSRGNVRARAMVWGAARFDQVDEHGQPAARASTGNFSGPTRTSPGSFPAAKPTSLAVVPSQLAVLSTAGA
jgi:hypothetical protein